MDEQKGDPQKVKKKDAPAEEKDPGAEKELFEQNFVFAVTWACGGACVNESRGEFSEYIKRIPNKFPNERNTTIFDYFPNSSGVQTPWSKVVPKYSPPEDAYLVTKVSI